MSGLGFSGWHRSEDAHSFAHIDFRSMRPPLFVGSEISFSAELTIFGSDLPQFRIWASESGVTCFHRISQPAEYLASNHALVAHQFEGEVSLRDIETATPRIRELMSCARQLILFIYIRDNCTEGEVRRALRRALPDFTFRIVYPRRVYRMWGARVILVEKRRPQAFLFVTGEPMAGKTETALLLNDLLNVPVVHGDEYLHGVLTGEIEADDDLRRRIVHLTDGSPFDRSLFSRLLTLIPEFERRQDFIFDFFMPYENHSQITQYFNEMGYFPILCVPPKHQSRFSANEQEIEVRQRAIEALTTEANRFRSDAEFYKAEADRLRSDAESDKAEADRLRSDAEFDKAEAGRRGSDAKSHKAEADRLGSEIESMRSSTSWKITAPMRWFGGRFPSLAMAGRRCLISVSRAPSSDSAKSGSC